MVMADRPEVKTAPMPVAAIDLLGLGAAMGTAALRLPFRDPWRGPGNVVRNLAVSATRETVRSFLGYATSLPVDEFRSVEKVVDTLAATVLPPWIRAEHVAVTHDKIAGVPGLWFRPRTTVVGRQMLYLHGGGYIGTSPTMYALFAARMARAARCEIFVADYRLAPEFPYPAPLDDALAVLRAMQDAAGPVGHVFVAGDSGGGGLAASVAYECGRDGSRKPAGLLLFSPEVSLVLDEPSVTENAPYDVLPWNVPTGAYLHGIDPYDAVVSASDVTQWPATFIAFGSDEIFRDPIRRLVDRLEQAGVDLTAHESPGMFHVFPLLLPWTASSRRTYARAGAFVAKVAGDQAASHPEASAV
jgi:acetyl esterase/lipase